MTWTPRHRHQDRRLPISPAAGFLWILPLLLTPLGTPTAGENPPEPVPVREWLLLGPVTAPLPAFHDEKAGGYSLEDFLQADQIRRPDLRPVRGHRVDWDRKNPLKWQVAKPEKNGKVSLKEDEGPGAAWLATYLRVPRFTPLELEVRSHHLLQIHVDGEPVAVKPTCTVEGEEPEGEKVDHPTAESGPEVLEAHLDLAPGVHRLLVKTVRDPDCERPWTVTAILKPSEEEFAGGISLGISPEHPLELAQVLDSPRPTDVFVSSDGTLAAIRFIRILPSTGEEESWVEIRRTAGDERVRTFRGLDLHHPAWGPKGHRLSYITRKTESDQVKGTLWVTDLDQGTTRAILESVDHLGTYAWVPDGGSVIYEVTTEPEKDDRGVQRLQGLKDRRAGWRDRTYLFQVTVPGGTRRRLTAGELTTTPGPISPDGTRLLFLREVEDYENRPYQRDDLYLLHLSSLETELVLQGNWLNGFGWPPGGASWSPSGDQLLLLGGPSEFDGIGRTTPEEVIANDYDGQAFLLDLETRKAIALSRDFHPSITAAVWHRGDAMIYLQATEGSRERLYRLDPERLRYTPIETGVDVVRKVDFAREAPVAVYSGSGVSRPEAVFAVDLPAGEPLLLVDPAAADFRHVRLGDVKPWSFVNRLGVRIEGRVYYPPDFDPAHRYPAILYYYGGTLPVSRSFGGRYPKNWWAAHGYVVLVLQPSGTVGYGQDFSALHVNAWGKITSEDILEGMEEFLEAHGFVDPDRVGCIGASYGGFMTQYLLTRTDRFAAAVSHAGISALTSYWGEGYWGYQYSAVASAGSFPWNRPDLYLDQSPLFQADRIHTPLLLLHGSADVNVPPGESEQLYTALKLLGREVEYVRIQGQDHHILRHPQRVVWSETILAWFDRWLKEEPEWWDHLHPEPGRKGKK